MNQTDKRGTEAAATAPAPEGKTAVEKKAARPVDTIGGLIEKLKPQIAAATGGVMSSDRFARIVLTAIRNNPDLLKSDQLSLMGSILTAAQLALEVNSPLGQAFVIPYKDTKTGRTMAQFQLGYKGAIELAHRSGRYRRISAVKVDKADKFEFAYGLQSKLIHTPAEKPTGEITHYYALYELENGGHDFKVWSREQAEQHGRRYSKSFDSKYSPWQTNFDSMALKSVLIDLLKIAPKSVELAHAYASDNRTLVLDPRASELTIDALEGDFELSGGEA